MEPTTVATISATDTPARAALPRLVTWTVLAIAAALPVILLATLIIVMIATQYNFLNWME